MVFAPVSESEKSLFSGLGNFYSFLIIGAAKKTKRENSEKQNTDRSFDGVKFCETRTVKFSFAFFRHSNPISTITIKLWML